MLGAEVQGRCFRLLVLLTVSVLVLSMVPAAVAGQGQGNGNGKGHGNGQGESPIQSGYAIITPVTPIPAGADPGLVVFETFGERHGLDMTQAGVLATDTSDHWALFTHTNGRLSRNLGVAIASPDAQAVVTLTLVDSLGNPVPDMAKSFEVATGSQVSKYVTELFADKESAVLQDFIGTLDISSTVPVGVVGLRFRGANFSTLPATRIGPMGELSDGPGALILPQFATGGGWASEIVVFNPTNIKLTVRVDLFAQDGDREPLPAALSSNITLLSQTSSSFVAEINPGAVWVLSPGEDF